MKWHYNISILYLYCRAPIPFQKFSRYEVLHMSKYWKISHNLKTQGYSRKIVKCFNSVSNSSYYWKDTCPYLSRSSSSVRYRASQNIEDETIWKHKFPAEEFLKCCNNVSNAEYYWKGKWIRTFPEILPVVNTSYTKILWKHMFVDEKLWSVITAFQILIILERQLTYTFPEVLLWYGYFISQNIQDTLIQKHTIWEVLTRYFCLRLIT